MGGDHAPQIVVEGASEAKIRHPGLEFTFFGDKEKVFPIIKKHKNTYEH